MSVSKCCIICYKPCPGNNEGQDDLQTIEENKVEEVLKRFFLLLGRHLSEEKQCSCKTGEDKLGLRIWKEFSLEEAINGGMSACWNCLKVMEGFCDFYGEMKRMGLLVNWKMLALNNVMQEADSVPGRINSLRDSILNGRNNLSANLTDTILGFKKRLIHNCSQKLQHSFPRVLVRKHLIPEVMQETSQIPMKRECQQEEELPLNIDIKFENSTHNQIIPPDSIITAVDGPVILNSRSLRTVQRCKVCTRTFSTPERLTEHQTSEKCQEKEKDEEDEDVDSIPSDPESGNDDNYEEMDCHDKDWNEHEAASDNDNKEESQTERISMKKEESQPKRVPKQNDEFQTKTVPKQTEQSQPNRVPIPEKKVHKHAISKTLPCPDCTLIFTNKFSLDRHTMISHPPEWKKRIPEGKPFPKLFYRFKCPDCTLLFRTLPKLLLHRRKTHSQSVEDFVDGGRILVDILSISTRPPPKLTRQCQKDAETFARIKILDQVYFCPNVECKLPFYSKKELEVHSKLHGNFKCNFCDVVETFAPQLATHETAHCGGSAGVENLQGKEDHQQICARCQLKFWNKAWYVQHHVKEHLGLTLNFSGCGVCESYSFSDALGDNLSKHWKFRKALSHYKVCHDLGDGESESSGVRQCEVEGCTAYFLERRQLRKHQSLRHKLDEKQRRTLNRVDLRCKDCNGKTFSTKSSLQYHRVKFHVNVSDVILCTFKNCRGKFETKEEQESHVRNMHSARKLHSCPKCQMKFYGQGPIKAHLRWHKRMEDTEAGILPQAKDVCEFCGKAFKNKNRLETHYLTHSGPESWEFSCSVCSKKCMDKYKLADHMRTHSEVKVKPFVCEICRQKYAHRHNLRIHVNSKHGDVVQDIPRKFDRSNLTSKKGVSKKGKNGNSS